MVAGMGAHSSETCQRIRSHLGLEAPLMRPDFPQNVKCILYLKHIDMPIF